MDKSFGAWLRSFRQERNLTQEELAGQLNFSAEYIRKLESNRRPPTEGVIRRLADFQEVRGAEGNEFIRFIHNEFIDPKQDTQHSHDHQEEPASTESSTQPPQGSDNAAPESPASGQPPYKGLSFFDVADAHLYFGRQMLITEVISLLAETNLESSRFLAVMGASGSGKSSFVRAGLIPALMRGQPLGNFTDSSLGSEHWSFHIVTPTAHPLESLAATLTQAHKSVIETATLVDNLWQDQRTLHLYVRRLVEPDNRLFLVIDQFEELFTLCKDKQERSAFIENLCYAARSDGFTYVVITLRADFYRHCLEFDRLRLLLEHHTKPIDAMDRDALRMAIVAPAKANGWNFDAGLVDLFLDDVGNEPGALPLLAHALRETWERRQGRILTFTGYINSGRVHGAIATTAEQVFAQLNDPQKIAAKRIFLRLTELGEGSEDTRRRLRRAELFFTEAQHQSVEQTLTILADARLITTYGDEVEVAHEALIREWPLLRTWLDDNREGLRIQHRLTESADEWQALEFDEGVLYRGARLEQALLWAEEHTDELNEQERRFLNASQITVEMAKKAEKETRNRALAQQRLLAEQEAKRAELAETRAREAAEYAQAKEVAARRLKLARNILVVISGLALFLAVLAGLFGRQSDRNANKANMLQATAEARATIAIAAQATAVYSARRANTERVAVQARLLSASTNPQDLAVALLLASHAVTTTLWHDGYVLANAELVLAESIAAAQRNQWRKVLELPHPTKLVSIAYSPDSQLIVSASDDPRIHIWDTRTGTEIHQLTGHTGKIRMVTFSPDGQLIVSASEDKTARIWDVTSGEERYQLVGHTGSVTAAKFSPDGQLIVSASEDQTVRIWDVSSRKELRQLAGHGAIVQWAEFSPDGRQVVSTGADGAVRIWAVTTGQEVRQLSGLKGNVPWALFSPDGQQIMSASEDGRVRIWNTTTGSSLRTFAGDTIRIRSVVYNPDGSQIVGTSGDVVRIWNVTSEKEVRQPITQAGEIRLVAVSPDGQQIATGSEDGRVRIWETTTSQEVHQLHGHEASVRMATFSADGQQIISTSEDTTMRIWDVKSGESIRQLTGHKSSIRSAFFNPDGRQIVSASQDSTIRIWDAKSGQQVDQLTGHDKAVWWAVFSPDGKRIVSCGEDSTIRIWDAASGLEVSQLLGHEKSVWSVAFRPDGRQIVSAGEDSTIRIWDVASGKEQQQLTGHIASVWSATFSPNGRQIVSAGDDGTIRIWDIASGTEVRQLLGHTQGVRSALFSPDGQQIASASADKTVRVWDAVSGREIRQLIGHTERALSVAYSPNGQQIVSAGADKTVRLWVASIDALLAQAHSLIQRDLALLTDEERRFYGME